MDAHLLRVLAGVSVVFAVACDGRTPPNPISSTPVPSVSPAPTPSATVSGTVLIHDASGVTRRANGWMFGWVQTEREGRTTGQVPTDADGRFRFAVPLGAQVRLQGSMPGAFQPCQVVVRARTRHHARHSHGRGPAATRCASSGGTAGADASRLGSCLRDSRWPAQSARGRSRRVGRSRWSGFRRGDDDDGCRWAIRAVRSRSMSRPRICLRRRRTIACSSLLSG